MMEAAPEPVMEEGRTRSNGKEPEVMEEHYQLHMQCRGISLPEGSGVPGCEETNECYIPYHVSIPVGD